MPATSSPADAPGAHGSGTLPRAWVIGAEAAKRLSATARRPTCYDDDMQRRSFLKVGLFGGLLLAVGAGLGLGLRQGDRSVRPTRALNVISEAAFPVLVAVAARVTRGTSASPVEIAQRVDEALRFAPRQSQQDLDRVLLLLENALGGLLLRGQGTPFTLLDEGDQDAALMAWRDSSVGLLRGAYHGLRKLCLAAHYASADCWAEVAYPGPSLTKTVPPPMSARAPLAVTEAPSAEGMP